MGLNSGSVRTARLLLRRPEPSDLGDVFRVHGDPATQRFNPAGPDPDVAASRTRLERWQDAPVLNPTTGSRPTA